jgi:hypothetical protein
VLATSKVAWYSGSDCLLRMKQKRSVRPLLRTREAVDIESGKRTTIESVERQINQAAMGWANSGVTKFTPVTELASSVTAQFLYIGWNIADCSQVLSKAAHPYVRITRWMDN